MRIGTKSVLFGAHQFLIHPWFVAWGWWTLYGFPFDPRLWVAFFVHDIGYLGKPNMDGPEGERHPLAGARVMTWLFDRLKNGGRPLNGIPQDLSGWFVAAEGDWIGPWGKFSLLHSRYYAKSIGCQPSRLCIADKLAIALTPGWLYLPMVRATGEIHEYMAHAKHRLVGNERVSADERRRLISGSQAEWYAGVQDYCRRWAMAHRDGAIDTWTSSARHRATVNDHGAMTTTSIEWTDKTMVELDADNVCPEGDPECQSNDDECHDGCEAPTRPRVFTDVLTHADRLDQPLHWKKPARIFVNSMSDLFHEDVPDAFIDQVFAVMMLAPRHTFQILTKRAERMREYVTSRPPLDEGHVAIWTEQGCEEKDGISSGSKYRAPWPLPNVWLGVSVENQEQADKRVPLLLQTPAAVRFISAEPLLGPIQIQPYMRNKLWNDLPSWKEPELDWVIVGGESGHGARVFNVAWARLIIAQCKAAGVPVFMKQLGRDPVDDLGSMTAPVPPQLPILNRKGGDPSEWPEDLRVREFPR